MTTTYQTWPPVRDVPDRAPSDLASLVAAHAARVARHLGGNRRSGKLGAPKRPCVCVETDERFPSVSAARERLGVSAATLWRALREGLPVGVNVNGQRVQWHFRYAEVRK